MFDELLSTQNVNVARFARNVVWDFSRDFQTLCLTFVYWVLNLSSCTSFGLSNDIGNGKEVLSTWLHFVNCVNVSGCYWLLIPRCVKFACVKTNTLTSWPIIKGGFFQELTHKYSDVSYKQLQILLFPASKLFFHQIYCVHLTKKLSHISGF